MRMDKLKKSTLVPKSFRRSPCQLMSKANGIRSVLATDSPGLSL
jgi:hypothetical protein